MKVQNEARLCPGTEDRALSFAALCY
jgi:hypothetical protein